MPFPKVGDFWKIQFYFPAMQWAHLLSCAFFTLDSLLFFTKAGMPFSLICLSYLCHRPTKSTLSIALTELLESLAGNKYKPDCFMLFATIRFLLVSFYWPFPKLLTNLSVIIKFTNWTIFKSILETWCTSCKANLDPLLVGKLTSSITIASAYPLLPILILPKFPSLHEVVLARGSMDGSSTINHLVGVLG